jgi:hypothetical protein
MITDKKKMSPDKRQILQVIFIDEPKGGIGAVTYVGPLVIYGDR